jgi:1-acyl-sn-glycerol-3-phosphate acyltransferase
MILRVVGRSCWFAAEVSWAVLDYVLHAAFAPAATKRAARAAWLGRASRRHLRIFNYRATISGPIPQRGLLVSNHLSYLDILVISSITPAVFVSKAEVRQWPLFGWLAALAGTVFVNRERRTQVGKTNLEIEQALAEDALVTLFPEGTSSNGKQLLPFKTSLLEPVAQNSHHIALCCLHYELTDGDASNDVCYWGDHSFFPHLVKLIGKRSIHAEVRFGTFKKETTDRKELARQLYDAVAALKKEPAAVP